MLVGCEHLNARALEKVSASDLNAYAWFNRRPHTSAGELVQLTTKSRASVWTVYCVEIGGRYVGARKLTVAQSPVEEADTVSGALGAPSENRESLSTLSRVFKAVRTWRPWRRRRAAADRIDWRDNEAIANAQRQASHDDGGRRASRVHQRIIRRSHDVGTVRAENIGSDKTA